MQKDKDEGLTLKDWYSETEAKDLWLKEQNRLGLRDDSSWSPARRDRLRLAQADARSWLAEPSDSRQAEKHHTFDQTHQI